MTTKLFRDAGDLGEYLFAILDDGGASADRLTVVFSDGDYLALSSQPSHPQGVSQSGENFNPGWMRQEIEAERAVELGWHDLPETIQSHVLSRLNEGFRDFLAQVECGSPRHVALSRDEAGVNDGGTFSTGRGLYLARDGYRVRLDGSPEEDRGPYADAREAVLATLPGRYDLSGPEYHAEVPAPTKEGSTDEDRLAALAALEARVRDEEPSLSPM